MVNAENLSSDANKIEGNSENKYDSVLKEVQELVGGPEDPDKTETIKSELNGEFKNVLENQEVFSALQQEVDKMKNNPDIEGLDLLSGVLDDFNKSKNGMENSVNDFKNNVENSFDDFKNNVENSFDDFKNEVMQTDTVVAQPPEQPVATNHGPLEFKEDNVVSAQPAEQPVATNHGPLEFKEDNVVSAQPAEQPVATNHGPVEFKEDNVVSAQPAEQPVATNHGPVEFKGDL